MTSFVVSSRTFVTVDDLDPAQSQLREGRRIVIDGGDLREIALLQYRVYPRPIAEDSAAEPAATKNRVNQRTAIGFQRITDTSFFIRVQYPNGPGVVPSKPG